MLFLELAIVRKSDSPFRLSKFFNPFSGEFQLFSLGTTFREIRSYVEPQLAAELARNRIGDDTFRWVRNLEKCFI